MCYNEFIEDEFSLPGTFSNNVEKEVLYGRNSSPKETFIMCSEPSSDLTIEKAKEMFDEIKTEAELAALYALFHNKAWWIEDEKYDFDEGTEEHKKSVERTDMWFALADKLKERIFDILKSEGLEIPVKGQIVVLEPFMKRNGFIDGQGWWIKE